MPNDLGWLTSLHKLAQLGIISSSQIRLGSTRYQLASLIKTSQASPSLSRLVELEPFSSPTGDNDVDHRDYIIVEDLFDDDAADRGSDEDVGATLLEPEDVGKI